MAKIKDRITKIADYFCGMEIKNGYYLIQVKYGHRWGAYNSQDERVKAARSEDEADVWYYYGDTDEVELDDIFDLIDETINMNKSALAKVELLKSKIEELKTVFENEPLDVLETLEFKFTDVKPKKKRKYTRRKKQEPTEAVNEEINEEVEVKETVANE